MSDNGSVTFPLAKNDDRGLTCRCVRLPGFAYIVKHDGATVVTGICEVCLRRNEHVLPGAPPPADDTPAWARLPWVEDPAGREGWTAQCGGTTLRVHRPTPGSLIGSHRWTGYLYMDALDHLSFDYPISCASADEAKAALVEAYRAWLLARLKEIE